VARKLTRMGRGCLGNRGPVRGGGSFEHGEGRLRGGSEAAAAYRPCAPPYRGVHGAVGPRWCVLPPYRFPAAPANTNPP